MPKVNSRLQRSVAGFLGVLASLAAAPAAFAHAPLREGVPQSLAELSRSWAFDPGVIVLLLVSMVLYVTGTLRLWQTVRTTRAVRLREAGCFALGWLTLVVALVSPLHPVGNALFAAHMVQHELLMLVAAPLLVLSRPLVPILWAFRRPWAAAFARAAAQPGCKTLTHLASNTLVAWLVHAVVLWAWHVPMLFDATLASDLVHAAQHASFFGSSLLFWWAIIYGHARARGYGVAVLYLFTTALHTGLLGALLSLAGTPWYPAYAGTTWAWGLSPMEDQQLGGLIMWIPAGIVYIVAGLVLFAAWLQESERRARQFLAAPNAAAPSPAVAGCGDSALTA